MARNNNKVRKASGSEAGGAGSAQAVSLAEGYAQAWSGDGDAGGGMFAPGAPIAPRITALDGLRDDEKPRVFDYAAGVNLYMQPRTGYGLMPFAMLRNFADLCDAVRIVIEAIKRELRALEWDIRPINEKDKTDYGAEIAALRAFWARPNGVDEFDSWCNALLEDMLVCDALTVWLDTGPEGADGESPEGSTIHTVDYIDGATIRPLLDVRGRIPAPPVPAYIQVIKGMSWQWFTSDRLIYRPFNTSTISPYGRSPIEFLVLRINEALRRQMSNAAYWDTTNVPEALAGLPETWTVEQIKTFQDYFDALLAGNVDKLRRLKWVPARAGTLPVYEFRRPDATAAGVADEWLIKMACWAFGFLPSELGIVSGQGLGGKGFMEGQENAQYRFGLGPYVQYLQNLFTGIVRRQTRAPLSFQFINIGPQEDQTRAAELRERQLHNGVIDVNVWRMEAGQQPIPNAKPFMVINGMPVLLDDLFTGRYQQALSGQQAQQPSILPTTELTTEAGVTEGSAESAAVQSAVAVAGAGADVQGTALNGAQITSLKEIVQAVANNELPIESALELVQIAFPTISAERARELLNPAAKFEPSANGSAGNGNGGGAAVPGRDADKSAGVANAVNVVSEKTIKQALASWYTKAARRVGDGKSPVCDPTELAKMVLPADLVAVVREQLVAAAGDPKRALGVFANIHVSHDHGHAHEHAHADGAPLGVGAARPFDVSLEAAAALAKAAPRHVTEARNEIEDALLAELGAAWDELAEGISLASTEDAERLLDPADEFWVRYVERVLPGLGATLAGAARTGVDEARDNSIFNGFRGSATVAWDVVNNSAANWARDYAAQLVRDVRDTTRENIRNAVAGWIESGEALPDLTQRIHGLINDERRAGLIAQTESTRAFAAGNEQAWQAGGVWGRRWFTVRDSIVCPVCRTLHGKVAKLGEPFIVVVNGRTYVIVRPPSHPGCRCYEQPVEAEEEVPA